MAVKAVVVDASGAHHLILGLDRENMDWLLDGDVFATGVTGPHFMRLSGVTGFPHC
ncbi:MAG: hypothetical protein WB992_05730 [Bryobacteraceae bacterium]